LGRSWLFRARCQPELLDLICIRHLGEHRGPNTQQVYFLIFNDRLSVADAVEVLGFSFTHFQVGLLEFAQKLQGRLHGCDVVLLLSLQLHAEALYVHQVALQELAVGSLQDGVDKCGEEQVSPIRFSPGIALLQHQAHHFRKVDHQVKFAFGCLHII